MSYTTVLAVTPEEVVEQGVGAVVQSIRGCRLETVADVAEASLRCREGDVGLLLVYLSDPTDVEELACFFEEAAKGPTPPPVIALADEDNPDLRLKLLRHGAVDFLVVPYDLPRLAFLADVLTVRARYESPTTVRRPNDAVPEDARSIEDFLFHCATMRQLLKQLRAVAPLETTLLVMGETGVGKTHLARVIHALSPRKTKPFLVVHCAALAPALLESELFGHVRGAFTHAERDRTGKLAEVRDGTLLLDEIDCVPLEAQAKLLRAVEERVFEPVGSNKSQPMRARLVAAANRPLEEEVAAGRFRADLYYRLNVVSFCLPPLRDRPELVRPLAEKFLADACSRDHRHTGGFAEEALHAMQAYHWPGNVRELRNVVDRAVALSSGGPIGLRELPEALRRDGLLQVAAAGVSEPSSANHLARARMVAECEHLKQTLLRHENNRTDTAAALGISRVTLYKKLRRYGLV
jgi:DNA-binding NtrC family response regulator